jgi:hypothetical protein
MNRVLVTTAMGLALGAAAAPLAAQTPASPRPSAEQREQRYQITTMEKVLEGAVEHGAKVTRDRLQAFVQADMLLSDNARARGYRLEGYGLFFDVAVPMLGGSLTWSFRTLDQNDLGLESALTALRTLVQKTGDTNLEQALTRIELQVAPMSLTAGMPAAQAPATPGARNLTGAVAATAADPAPPSPDPILDDPEEAYRTEVRDALMNAMVDHGAALRIAASELLTIAARGSDDRSVLGPLNNDAQTTMISVRGSDLTAYLSGQISWDEVRQRLTVRVF